MKTFTINLPNFDGFYHSLIDVDGYLEDCVGDDENHCLITSDDYDDINWEKTYNKIARLFFDIWEEKNKEILKTFGIELKFSHVDSPREYNFTTDKCVLFVSITNEVKTKSLFLKYAEDNYKEFSDLIKNLFTSYDGFHSFYSNSGLKWLNEYINQLFDDNVIFETFLESITEDLTDDEKIYDLMDNFFELIEYN